MRLLAASALSRTAKPSGVRLSRWASAGRAARDAGAGSRRKRAGLAESLTRGVGPPGSSHQVRTPARPPILEVFRAVPIDCVWHANAPHQLQGRGAFTTVWRSAGGCASPYANRWPRPASCMRLLDGTIRERAQTISRCQVAPASRAAFLLPAASQENPLR